MKITHILIIAAALLITLSGFGQTNSTTIPVVQPFNQSQLAILGPLAGPATVTINYLLPNTNAIQATRWTFFGCYTKASGLPATSKSSVGYSFGSVYYVNSLVGTQMRMQYLDTGNGGGANGILLPNGEITLSSAYHPFNSVNWITIRPIAEMGAASNLKGNLYAVVGAGTELDVYSTTNTASALQRLSIFYGKEQWQGSDKFTDTQYGFALNFNLESLMTKIAKTFTK